MKLIDALFPAAIPTGVTCDAIAAYIDHDKNPQSYAQAVARFPNAVHIPITVTGDPAADAIDGERGTGLTPADCVAWARKKRLAGQPRINYCNEMLTDGWGWAAYRAAYTAAGEPDPYWWVADYDGNPTDPAGAWGKQFWDLDASGRNTYDTSITGPWPPALEEDMPLTDADAQLVAQHVHDMVITKADGLSAPQNLGHLLAEQRGLLGFVVNVLRDPSAFAAAIAAKLPAGSVTAAQLEVALKAALASLAD